MDDLTHILRKDFGILTKQDETGLLVAQFDGDPAIMDTSRSAADLFGALINNAPLKYQRLVYRDRGARGTA